MNWHVVHVSVIILFISFQLSRGHIMRVQKDLANNYDLSS